MATTKPRKNGTLGNVCAFCHFWNGNACIEPYGMFNVQYDERATGQCLARSRSTYKASHPACRNFQMSNEVSRYCK